MHKKWLLLGLALPLAPLAAQEEAAAKPTPAQQFAKLEKAYLEASKAWMDAYRAAAEAKDKEATQKLLANRAESEFVDQFLKGAEECAGTEDAVPFLVWVATRGYSDQKKMVTAIETLVNDHVKSDRLMPVADMIGSMAYSFGKERAHDLLTRLVDQNGNVEIEANALFTRAQMYVGTRGGDATDAQREQAIADLRKSLELTKDEGLSELVRGAIHEEETLGVGKPAPDIVGEDLDGVPFKLSDYRGKVVMLDFWGDW